MNYTKVKALGKEMNKLEKPRFTIKNGKTFDLKERWVIFDNENSEWVIAGKDYQELKVMAVQWSVEAALERLDDRVSLQLVVSNPYNWYELRVRKLNQTASTRIRRQNSVGLKLVG
jgi:hypothetical protein